MSVIKLWSDVFCLSKHPTVVGCVLSSRGAPALPGPLASHCVDSPRSQAFPKFPKGAESGVECLDGPLTSGLHELPKGPINREQV